MLTTRSGGYFLSYWHSHYACWLHMACWVTQLASCCRTEYTFMLPANSLLYHPQFTPCGQLLVICKHLGMVWEGSRQFFVVDHKQYGTQNTALRYTPGNRCLRWLHTTDHQVPGSVCQARDNAPQHVSTYSHCWHFQQQSLMWHSVKGLLEVHVNDINTTSFFSPLCPDIISKISSKLVVQGLPLSNFVCT